MEDSHQQPPSARPTTIPYSISIEECPSMSDSEKVADEFAFDPSVKKKKPKKKVAFNNDEENLLEAGDADDVVELGGKLDKATISSDLPAEDNGDDDDDLLDNTLTKPKPAVSDDVESFDFTAKKKKKKKKVDTSAFDSELAESGLGDDEEGDAPAAEDEMAGAESGVAAGEEPWLASDRDYTYKELLGRLFKVHRLNNPDADSGEKRKYTIVPPNVQREGSKKTNFANLAEIAKRMHRSVDHVIAFIYAELGTTGSIAGGGQLILRGRFQQKQIETVLRRYIMEYVTCKTCRSPDTVLVKENRLFFLDCEQCNSRRSVQAIKTGFSAQITKRRLLKTN